MRVRYLYQRDGILRYRRVVPSDVRDIIGQQEWIKTFPGLPMVRAVRKVESLARQHDRLIAEARGQEVKPEVIAEAEADARTWLAGDRARVYELLSWYSDEFRDLEMPQSAAVFVNAIEHDGRYRPERLSLAAVYAKDRELYGGKRDEVPIRAAVERFIADVGNRDIRTLRAAEVADWLATVTDWKAGTVLRRLGALRALWNRAARLHDIETRNPFEKHRLRGGGKSTDRLPFSRAMLALIDAHLLRPRVRPVTRQLIQLMRNTGCGPAEIGGLVVGDVVLGGAIPFIHVRPNGLLALKVEGEGSARARRVPLIGEGLGAAREAVQRVSVSAKGQGKGSLQLFPSYRVPRGADGISATCNKAIRAAGVPESPRLTSYSFRHTLKEALRSAQVADHVQRRLLGHAGAGVSDRYGSPTARLEEKATAMEAALAYLGDVDESIYSEHEMLHLR